MCPLPFTITTTSHHIFFVFYLVFVKLEISQIAIQRIRIWAEAFGKYVVEIIQKVD